MDEKRVSPPGNNVRDQESSNINDPVVINRVVTYFSSPDPKGRRKRWKKVQRERIPFNDYYFI